MSQYTVTVANNNIQITAAPVEHSISLSRTGGQGSQGPIGNTGPTGSGGNSITSAVVNASNELIITISDASGNVVSTTNAGTIDVTGGFIQIDELQDVDATGATDGDALLYDSSTSRWTTRKSSTDDIDDINNAGKTEGAVLMYDAATSKYISTHLLDSSGTQIIGGTF